MKYQDLEELAKAGKLRVNKHLYRENVRRLMIWSKDPDILDQRIIGHKDVQYKIYRYEARTPDMDEHQSYKITKKDYEELGKILPCG